MIGSGGVQYMSKEIDMGELMVTLVLQVQRTKEPFYLTIPTIFYHKLEAQG